MNRMFWVYGKDRAWSGRMWDTYRFDYDRETNDPLLVWPHGCTGDELAAALTADGIEFGRQEWSDERLNAYFGLVAKAKATYALRKEEKV